MNRAITRAFMLAGVLCALFALRPESAQASGVIVFDDAKIRGLMLGTTAIAFGALDIAFFAADRPLPVGLAIVQIAVAGVTVPLMAVGAHDSALAIGAFINLAWFTGHGIYNLSIYPEYARERRRLRDEERARRCAEACGVPYGPLRP